MSNRPDPFGDPAVAPEQSEEESFEFELEGEPELIDPGEYVVRCTSARCANSQAGNPMIWWNFYIESEGKTFSTCTVTNNDIGRRIANDFLKVLASPEDIAACTVNGKIKIKTNSTGNILKPEVQFKKAIAVVKHGKNQDGSAKLDTQRLKALPTEMVKSDPPYVDRGVSRDYDIPF